MKKTKLHLLQQHCNQLFIKLLRGATDEKINDMLDAVVSLFQCLVQRDLFLKKYGDFLAKRLLDKSTVSDDAEESMINKIAVHTGQTPLIKITGMRKDIKISEELFNTFKSKKNATPYGINLDVRILSAGAWPSHMQPLKLQLPKLITNTIGGFKTFQTDKFAGRLINLLPTEGNCEMEVLFADKN